MTSTSTDAVSDRPSAPSGWNRRAEDRRRQKELEEATWGWPGTVADGVDPLGVAGDPAGGEPDHGGDHHQDQ